MSRLLFISVIIFAILVIWFLVIPFPQTGKSLPRPTPTPIPASPSITTTEEINITVYSPVNLSKVSSPITVRGSARVFENVVSIRLSTTQGAVLIQTTAYADAPDIGQYGDFEKVLTFNTDEKEGILEVYQASAKDGSEIDKVTIPLLFE